MATSTRPGEPIPAESLTYLGQAGAGCLLAPVTVMNLFPRALNDETSSHSFFGCCFALNKETRYPRYYIFRPPTTTKKTLLLLLYYQGRRHHKLLLLLTQCSNACVCVFCLHSRGHGGLRFAPAPGSCVYLTEFSLLFGLSPSIIQSNVVCWRVVYIYAPTLWRAVGGTMLTRQGPSGQRTGYCGRQAV
jgi:hypothetical protein